MVNVVKKERICREYEVLLKIIYMIGNKIMLQSQFLELAKLFNLIKTDYEANKIIKELEEAELIKKEQYLDTKYKLLILKKYSIKFIECKEKSCEVASVPLQITERAMISIIKTNYFIDFSKQILNINNKATFYDCIKRAKGAGTTYLYKKNEGLEYLNYLSNSNIYNKDNKIHKLSIEKRKETLKNRKKGQEKRLHKGTKGKLYSEVGANIENKIYNIKDLKDIRTRIEKEIDNVTIDTLLNSYIYVSKFSVKNDVITVNADIYDINNTQNINKIIEKILKLCYVYRNIISKECKFNVTIYVENEVAKHRLYNAFNQKDYKGETYLEKKLNSYSRATAIRDTIMLELKLDIKDIKIDILESTLSKYL